MAMRARPSAPRMTWTGWPIAKESFWMTAIVRPLSKRIVHSWA